MYQGDYSEATALMRQVVALDSAHAAAQPLFEESLERMGKVYGPEHPDDKPDRAAAFRERAEGGATTR